MADNIDITINETVENIDIVVNPNLIEVNITRIEGASVEKLVPYIGAIDDVNLGSFDLTANNVNVDVVNFDLNPIVPTSVGSLYWDNVNKTLSLIDGVGATTLQIGQEERVLIKNTTGATLTDGKIVYITGATGNLPSVSLASALNETTSAATLGMVTETITNGSSGFVTITGLVNGLNTLAFNEGDILWLSNTAGEYTNIKPTSPSHLVLIGYVTKKSANGSIYVKIQNTQELNECSDVLFGTLSNNDLLVYESSTGLWKNKQLSTLLGGTGSQFVKGNGSLDSTIYATQSALNTEVTNRTNADASTLASANNYTDAGLATKQNALSGTGIVKSTGGTISYLTDNSSNWNTAFSWGNHAGLYAPLSGGSNYIQNQNSSAQLANIWVNGGINFENNSITPQFGTGLKSRFFTNNSEGVKAIQDWTDGYGNVRAFLGDVNNLGAGTALKLIGTQGRSEIVELALMQTSTVLRDYGTTLVTKDVSSDFEIGIRKNNIERLAFKINNLDNGFSLYPREGSAVSVISDNLYSPILTLYNNGGVNEWAMYQGASNYDNDFHIARKYSSTYTDYFKVSSNTGKISLTSSDNIPLDIKTTSSETYINLRNSASGISYGVMLFADGNDFQVRTTDSNTRRLKINGTTGVLGIDNLAGSGNRIVEADPNGNLVASTNLATKADLLSPTFTGTPTAPTAPAGTNTTQIATTAFVQNAVSTGGITGTGTANYLPKFTGANSLGNSLIYDNGTYVGIGTTSDNGYKLNVNGNLSLGLNASAPTGVEGAIYYNSTTKKHYGFDGTTWNALY